MAEKLNKTFYGLAGIAFLIMAKTKNVLYGYRSPKPFPVTEYDRCVDYDLKVVDEWLDALHEYTSERDSIKGKSILELGPGSDLGTGLYLLARGAGKYAAIDVNDLVANAPDELYERLLDRLESMESTTAERDYLGEQISLVSAEQPHDLTFTCRPDFDIAEAFKGQEFDLIFSQAAFEHFDNIPVTLEQLTRVSSKGAMLVSVVDLQTHSRWIRDKDPNNIYRYGDKLYRALSFRGSPNRVRPVDYEEALRKLGWTNIVVKPLTTTAETQNQHKFHVHSDFHADESQMDILSFLLFATRA